jgi:ParB-like chromosome segregation protein Spo0J
MPEWPIMNVPVGLLWHLQPLWPVPVRHVLVLRRDAMAQVAEALGVIQPTVAPSDRARYPRPGSSGVTAGEQVQVVACASLIPGDTPRLEGENVEHVQALAEAQTSWPPVLVHRETMRIIDGMHRLLAAQLRAEQTIRVRFFDGDKDEAFIAAVRENVTHGLPLTLADRRAAALRIIGSQSHRSDRWIGDVTGLAPGTVSSIRRYAGTLETHDTARIGRDGRVRPLSSATGRLRAQQEIIQNPGVSLRQIARAAGISVATAKDVRDRLLSGDDPVPANQQGRGRRPSAVGPSLDRRNQRAGHDTGKDLAWSLQRLAKDPSLRYTDAGRALIQWLSNHARGPDPMVLGLIDKMPPHCRYLIADIARGCAEKWNEFATGLDQQLRHG